MRLALILPAETEYLGGVQRFAWALLGALKDVCDELETFRLHPSKGSSWILAALRGSASLMERDEARPFDAVFSTWHGPHKILPQIPMGGFIHDLRAVDLKQPSFELLARKLIVHSWDVVCVPSTHVAFDVRELSRGARVEVVGEGLDHLSNIACPHLPWSQRDGLIVIAGRAPHKRAALGVIAAQMAAARLNCEVTVLGEAPGAELTSKTRVLSRYSDIELTELLGTARVVVASTSFEGFGLAVGEAMFFGAPIVYSDDSYLGSLVAEGGIEVRPDVNSFRDAILRAWDQPWLASSAHSLSRRYTWRGTAEKIAQAMSS